MKRTISKGSVWGRKGARVYRNGPAEQSAQSLSMSAAGTEQLNERRIAQLQGILLNRQLMTSAGCASVCGVLIAMSESKFAKVQALVDLGEMARHIVSGIPKGRI